MHTQAYIVPTQMLLHIYGCIYTHTKYTLMHTEKDKHSCQKFTISPILLQESEFFPLSPQRNRPHYMM